MSHFEMSEAILQTATDLTMGVIIAYLEEENPNGFDDDGYPIVRDLGEPTALEDAIHALTEWALNWHDLGEPPKAKNEAEYALALLHRVQDKYAPDEMRGLKYSDYLDTWLLPQCKVTVMPILARTAPVFGFTDEDIVEMWILIQEMRGHLPVAQDTTNG